MNSTRGKLIKTSQNVCSLNNGRFNWKYEIIHLMGHDGVQEASTVVIQFFAPNQLIHRSAGYMGGLIPFDFTGPYLFPYAR